ncbi:DUF2634 domain-containing protein [Chengkuizengella sp. SCS-71B]|uniref:DUF2634 domain-containing protein n=1 Tax=Chengkuizengella sp. SCS-71B TaxID=3115290 RepID=UPI0032C23567
MTFSPIQKKTVEQEISRQENTIQRDDPLKTYELDFDSGEIGEYINGIDALKQYIRKALETARYNYLIYDDQYGSELEAAIGDTPTHELLTSEIPRYIEEALIYHPQIENVYDFHIVQEGDGVYVSFLVDSLLGKFEEEVNWHGI